MRLADEGLREGTTQELNLRKHLLPKLESSKWTPAPYYARKCKVQHRFGRSAVNLFEENNGITYIPLKPVVKGNPILPYLSVVANKSLSVFRLLLLVFVAESKKDRLKSIGLRFESPEGSDGRHDFWHVQLTSSFEQNGGQRHPSTPAWLPSSAPAMPLDANSAASCVVALAVSLYGGVTAATLVRNLAPEVSRASVKRLMDEVRALSANRDA